jgi:protein ImuB
MYACLSMPGVAGAGDTVFQLARQFSPCVERTSSDAVVFSITPLRRLMGSPHQIASELCRQGDEQKLRAHLAMASNPDTAVILARHYQGVTLVTPGEEYLKLAPIPLVNLFAHDLPVDHKILEVLHHWGLKTCEDLADMPEKGLAERLGSGGIYLRNLAAGRIHRPLRIAVEEAPYEQRVELEYPVALLEPLLFLFGRVLSDLCGRMRSQTRAARLIDLQLELTPDVIPDESSAAAPEISQDQPLTKLKARLYRCSLEFPVPVDQTATILKLLQLHLERYPAGAPTLAFTLRLEVVEPKRLKGGLFLPSTPQPDKLHVTLKRIEDMVGQGSVGVPQLLDTHSPDAFQLSMGLSRGLTKMGLTKMDLPQKDLENPAKLDRAKSTHPKSSKSSSDPAPYAAGTLRLSLRIFRPALHARVRLAGVIPKQIVAPGVQGSVLESAGPWKTSGDWWTFAPWSREEWDVALDDGAFYRIYCEVLSREWYVHAAYD